MVCRRLAEVFRIQLTLPNSISEYLGEIMDLCYTHRADNLDHRYLDNASSSARAIVTCIMPLNEIVTDFFGKLKSLSSGFASFE